MDVYKWDWSVFQSGLVPDPYTYQITTQLYKVGSHDAINIEFGVDMSIEDAEKFIKTLFDVGLVEAYELAE